MPSYEAFLSDTITAGRRDLVIVPDGATAPDDHTSIGEFEYDASHKSDVIYHHLHDLCYTAGIQDMQNLNIKYDNKVAITDFDFDSDAVTVEEDATVTVAVWIRPGHANMGTITAESNDTDIATEAYNAETRIITITGVLAGETTITVAMGELHKTVAVTVVEPE